MLSKRICFIFHSSKGHFPSSFRWGCCHHTPDTEQAMKAISAYVKEQGRLSIWVYPPQMKKVTDYWRTVTAVAS